MFPGEGLTGIWCTSLAGTTVVADNIIAGGGVGRGLLIILDSSNLSFPDVQIRDNTLMNINSPQSTSIRVINESRSTSFERIAIIRNQFVQVSPTDSAIRFHPSPLLGQAGFGNVQIMENLLTPSIASQVLGISI